MTPKQLENMKIIYNTKKTVQSKIMRNYVKTICYTHLYYKMEDEVISAGVFYFSFFFDSKKRKEKKFNRFKEQKK